VDVADCRHALYLGWCVLHTRCDAESDPDRNARANSDPFANCTTAHHSAAVIGDSPGLAPTPFTIARGGLARRGGTMAIAEGASILTAEPHCFANAFHLRCELNWQKGVGCGRACDSLEGENVVCKEEFSGPSGC
jgi:hypothetical protein